MPIASNQECRCQCWLLCSQRQLPVQEWQRLVWLLSEWTELFRVDRETNSCSLECAVRWRAQLKNSARVVDKHTSTKNEENLELVFHTDWYTVSVLSFYIAIAELCNWPMKHQVAMVSLPFLRSIISPDCCGIYSCVPWGTLQSQETSKENFLAACPEESTYSGVGLMVSGANVILARATFTKEWRDWTFLLCFRHKAMLLILKPEFLLNAREYLKPWNHFRSFVHMQRIPLYMTV